MINENNKIYYKDYSTAFLNKYSALYFRKKCELWGKIFNDLEINESNIDEYELHYDQMIWKVELWKKNGEFICNMPLPKIEVK